MIKPISFFVLFGLSLISALASANEPATVTVRPLRAVAVYPQHAAPATVISRNTSDISAEVAARVTAFFPKVGDIVEPGAVIAKLDCRDYALELRRARAERDVVKARLELAKQRLQRAQELAERNSLAVETLNEREAEKAVRVAEIQAFSARIARAQVAISRCEIKSPFRALIRERLAPIGQFAAVGTPIVRVIDIDDIEVSARIQANDTAAVNASKALEFSTSGQRFAVQTRVVVNAIDAQTRNQEVRLSFVDERPLSGAAGQLLWSDTRAHVPGKYIVRRGDDLGIFITRERKAVFVVLPDAQAGRACPVDIELDRQLVVEGHYGLSDGQAVSIQESL